MVVHLGRLKMVVRRKKGKCVYKYCDKDNTVLPGDKVFLVTKMGGIPGRAGPVIFYKAFHRDCFGHWALFCWDTIELNSDGRPKMDLPDKEFNDRTKLVRERSRILRGIRTIESGDRLDKRIARLTEVDRLIGETGYPILHYKGRRSKSMIEFEKFIEEEKEQYGTEMRVPKKVFDQAKDTGMEAEFKSEMNKWRKEETQQVTSRPKHYEDIQEDEGEKEE